MPRTRAQGASPGGFKALDMKATRKSTRKRARDETVEKKPTPVKRKKNNDGRKSVASQNVPFTLPKPQPHLENIENYESLFEDNDESPVEDNYVSPFEDEESHEPESHEPKSHEQEPQEQSQDERSQPTSADEQSAQEDRVEDDSETTPEYLATEATESTQKAPATPNPNNRKLKDTTQTPSTYPGLMSRLSRLSSLAAVENKVRESEEKALSECDDDEWEGRIDEELSAAAGAKSRDRRLTTTGMFPQGNKTPSNRPETVTWKDPSRKNTPSSQSYDAPSSSKEPSNQSTRARYNSRGYIKLKNPAIIAMFSAANELFENNPSLPIPTPTQITDLLRNFLPDTANPSKASLSTTRASTEATSTEEPSPPLPESPSDSDANDPSSRKRSRAECDEQGRNEDGNKRVKFEVPGASDSESEEKEKETVTGDSDKVPQAPLNHEPAVGGWADMFNPRHILDTPIKYFNRSAASRHRSASEVRPRAQAINVDTPMRGESSKREAPATISHLAALGARLFSSKKKYKGHYLPHPNGRLDMHLPMSLRGVQYKDLPAEYQAVSQHMQPTPPTDPDALAEWALARKHKFPNEPFEGFDDTPASESLIDDETPSKKSRSTPTTSVTSNATGSGKRRKIAVPKVYEGKLGPSSFGMPENIYDTTSEEEISILDHESPEIQQKVASPPKEVKWVSWTERMRILRESEANPDQQAKINEQAKVNAQQPNTNVSKPSVNIYQDEDADNELSQEEDVGTWKSLDQYLPEDKKDVLSEDEWDASEFGEQLRSCYRHDMITIKREAKSKAELKRLITEYKEYHERKLCFYKAHSPSEYRAAGGLNPFPQFDFLVGKVIGDPSRAAPYTGSSRLPASIRRLVKEQDQHVPAPIASVPLFPTRRRRSKPLYAASSSQSFEEGQFAASPSTSSTPRVSFGPNQYFDAPAPFAPLFRVVSRSSSPYRSILKKPKADMTPVRSSVTEPLSPITSQQVLPSVETAPVIDSHDSGKHNKENLFAREGSPEKTLQELIREQLRKAQQHLPKTPSRLQESTTVSSSPSSVSNEELQDDSDSHSMAHYAVDILSEAIAHDMDWIRIVDQEVYDDVTSRVETTITEATKLVESMNPLYDDDVRIAAHVAATSQVDEVLDRMDAALKAQRIELGETRSVLQIEANKKYLAAFSQKVGNGLKEGPHWDADLHEVDFGRSIPN